ncbi:MAG: phosphoribosyltransferase [Burkholderiaceae bacterium]|nr:phosphoribosyltransferase [Burkholderiaceae bacterium]MCD6675413.1 phosphoribosyltransferase [Burkholderiaceae bacterium]
MRDLHVSWDEYNRLVEKLALKVWDSGWNFDAVVCVARGGLRIGDVFSRLFDKPLGVVFTSSYREDEGKRRGELHIGEHLACAGALPGPNWLLTDDLADSGATLVQLVPALLGRHPQAREIRTAVLWRKGASIAQPDYAVEHLPSNPWIHQPFEEYDHMRPGDLKARWG